MSVVVWDVSVVMRGHECGDVGHECGDAGT